MKTIPNLTGLRFFLALFVILYHVPLFCKYQNIPYFNDLPVFHKGQEAVYVFFSLSGFLIIRLLYIEKVETNKINLKNFFLRRIFRIFPLYFAVLIFGFLYYRILLPGLGFTVTNDYNLIEGIILMTFFLPNIFTIPNAPGSVLEVLWSIGIEEQFYLFIAPLIYYIPRKKIVYSLLLFTIIYYIIFFYSGYNFFIKYWMYFFYFSISGLGAILELKYEFKSTLIRNILILIFIIYFSTSIFNTYFSVAMYHLFGMCLFTLFLIYLANKPIKILESELLKYLGKISYGIYMLHMIVAQLAGFIYLKVLKSYNFSDLLNLLFINFFVLLGTILLASLSYEYFETYFLKLKSRFR